MKRYFIITAIAAFCITGGVKAPEAKFFTDPSVGLEQSDWEGKDKSTAPKDEYQYKEEKKEEPPEEIKEEEKEEKKEEKKQEKKKERKKRKNSPAQVRDKVQFGLKIGYNLIPKLEIDSGGGFYEIWGDGSRQSVDFGMELIVNILGGHLGIGAGVAATFDYNEDTYTNTMFFVPVYGIIKGYLFKGHSPFVSLSLGYNTYIHYITDDDTASFDDYSGGLYFSIGAGFISRGGFQIEIQYIIAQGGITINGFDYDVKHSHLTIGIAKFF